MFSLMPKSPVFYDQFDRVAELIVRASEHFLNYLDHFENPQKHADEVKRLEHEADEVTHETMALLHKTFITPIERGDIRRLVKALDDILDFIEDATRRIALYEITAVLPEAKTLARVLFDSSKGVQAAVKEIRSLRKSESILQHCIEINRLENEGDHIHHRALARLFQSGMDPLSVIKWKEIFEDIETAIDRCEDVANLVEGIVLENS